MNRSRPYIATLCTLLMLVPAGGFAGDNDKPGAPPSPDQDNPQPIENQSHGLFRRVTNPYRAKLVPPPVTGNSGRLDSLLRGGNIYLSLQDAIALALENNLDIAIQRYTPQLADAAVELAEAGGFARGVSTNVTAGPASSSVSSAGTTPGATQAAGAASSAASSSAVGGSVLSSSGPPIPALDPAFIGTLSWGHITTPQTSAFLTGSNALIQRQNIGNFGISKGFLT